MWANVLAATNWAFVWLLLSIVIYFFMQSDEVEKRLLVWPVGGLFLVVFLAFVVRIVPMILLPVGAAYDIESFRLVGEALLSGKDVYTSAAVGRHPYLPLQMYPIGAALYLARITAVPFVVWVKVPVVLADVAITAILYQASYQRHQASALTLAALYALNPISFLTSAYHGQFDAIPILFLLYAWYTYDIKQQPIVSAVSLGFAILSKSWPVIFAPVMWLRLRHDKSRVLYFIVAFAIPLFFTLAYIVLFKTDPTPMLRRALSHTGVPGYWGLSAILKVLASQWGIAETAFQILQQANQVLLLIVGIFALWHTRYQSSLAALTTIILCIFAVNIGMGLQWLLWIIPFAILTAERRWLNLYTFVGTIFLIIQLYGYHMYKWANILLTPNVSQVLIRLSAIPIWLVVVCWSIYRIKKQDSDWLEADENI